MNRERTCAGCTTTFTGNHRVRDGEPYCNDCEPMEVGKGIAREDFEEAKTDDEYMARRATFVHVGELMDGGQVR